MPLKQAELALQQAQTRLDNEVAKRAQLSAGVLGLDLYNLRPPLRNLVVVYLDASV